MIIKFLCSDIEPLGIEKGQEIIHDRFKMELAKADEIKISVAYCSEDSLWELERLVDLYEIKKVNVVLGMYRSSNFPASRWTTAKKINRKWKKAGMGEIKMTKKLWYHGKKYCFLKDNQIFSAIVGSANLSFLDSRNQSQYEEGVLVEEPEALQVILNQVNKLLSKDVSENVSKIMRKSSSRGKKSKKKK
ncbi:restriction endonuclease PLD domain-containing protein [Mycoplasma wenyonii]|uniref:restriction endonuclease PLD domain-containing protein n=1 Tax=Mycoplasma wenyonii TaxID=65123 RepID=UPI0013051109|nr:restriction endonuclease PLD domain-containing protein [Mycoplasma wenyonii]